MNAALSFGYSILQATMIGTIIEIGDEYEDWLAKQTPIDKPPVVDEWSTFTIPYTSGTTGKPKGVLVTHRSRLMRLGNQAMTLATNILYGSKLNDMETCYKLIDRRLFQSLDLQSRRFEIEAEITAKLLLSGVKIHEAPIRYEHREEGKKLTPMDGLPTLSKLIATRTWRPERQWEAGSDQSNLSGAG